MGRVLVTGATGFIGSHLIEALQAVGAETIAAARGIARVPTGIAMVPFALEQPERLTADMIRGVECIYHLAARVHVMRRGEADESSYQALNAQASQVLARIAAQSGVRRFVYLSSIKVNGERTLDRPFTAADAPAPEDAYGRSKLAAERALMLVAEQTGLEVVIVRPPLVYGPGVGANFRRLISLVDAGWLLPFGAVANQRSLVSVWNLVSLLIEVGRSTHAAGRVWLVSDGEDISTPRLIELLSHGLGGATRRQLGISVPVLRAIGAATGMRAQVARLVESLQVDISATRAMLGWEPPMGIGEGIARTAVWFKTHHAA